MLPVVRADLHCSAEINGENVCDWINDHTGVGIAILLGIREFFTHLHHIALKSKTHHASRPSAPTPTAFTPSVGTVVFFLFLFAHMRADQSSRWSLPPTAPSQDYLRAISPAPQLPPIASRSASPFPFAAAAGSSSSPKKDTFDGETVRPGSYQYVNTFANFGTSSTTSSLVRPPPAYDSPQMRSSVQAGQYHGFAI
ncbi:hypothetical protein CONPUDRAFT_156833 [Coniophora puteana RWD-64-598 SS2]|uniref:Uncharacterized protein n=1 Tax=Coniophora puteana (strain RWD-64-598) TaxID=741705 RepID=A0A5M3MEQ6_CONPW|nr:uncharacterized protein CONPUDRAFT_156833 [Coniophora puteana RWD-64-598 SS2]EIW77633.1 hypothetical protein CONPUDRAFT_156833 [Coniophora puteana RWD-64-598 SS2]